MSAMVKKAIATGGAACESTFGITFGDLDTELMFGKDGEGENAGGWGISAEVQKNLEQHFEERASPDLDTRKRIGIELGLSPHQVDAWFQNKKHGTAKRPGGKAGVPALAPPLSTFATSPNPTTSIPQNKTPKASKKRKANAAMRERDSNAQRPKTTDPLAPTPIKPKNLKAATDLAASASASPAAAEPPAWVAEALKAGWVPAPSADSFVAAVAPSAAAAPPPPAAVSVPCVSAPSSSATAVSAPESAKPPTPATAVMMSAIAQNAEEVASKASATPSLALHIHPDIGDDALAKLYLVLCQMRQGIAARKSSSVGAECDAAKRTGPTRAFGNPIQPSGSRGAAASSTAADMCTAGPASPRRCVPFSDQGVVRAPNYLEQTETIGQLWSQALEAQSEQTCNQREVNPLNAAFIAATTCEGSLQQAGVFDFDGADAAAFTSLMADEFEGVEGFDDIFSADDVWA